MSLSYCCLPKQVLSSLGPEPFKMKKAEDAYFFNLLAPAWTSRLYTRSAGGV